MSDWKPIGPDTPKDRPILGWCVDVDDHETKPDGTARMSIYLAHAEGMGRVEDGPHVLVWGGAFDDSSWEYPNQASLPDWWFLSGSEFEMAANPTHWMDIPPEPRRVVEPVRRKEGV